MRIEIQFHQTEYPNRRITFIKAFQNHFGMFIEKPNNDPSVFRIHFVERLHFEIFNKSGIEKYYLNFYEKSTKNSLISYYHVSILEIEFILRTIIQDLLVNNKGFILHASACLINGKANLFTGASGIGKSTIITLLRNQYQAIADDNVIIREIDGLYYLYQLPITEKEWWVTKRKNKYLLKKVFFLHQSKKFSMKQLQDKEHILARITQQFWMNDKTNISNQMNCILKFISRFHHFYILSFRKEKEGLINILSEKTEWHTKSLSE